MSGGGASFGAYPLTRIHEAFTSLYAAPGAPPFSPVDLSPIAWVDMAQQSGTNGSPLATLQDNAVSGRTYTNTPGRTYQASGKNGLATLATGNYIYSASSYPTIASSSPCLFWAVMQTGGADGYLWRGSPNIQVRFNFGGSANPFVLYSGALAQSNALAAGESTTWAIYFIHRNAANQVRFYYNGSPKFGSPPTLTGDFTLDLFLGYLSGFVCEFAEAGILNTDPSTAQLNQLGAYLAAKWAIAWTNI